jgi:adenylate kinase
MGGISPAPADAVNLLVLGPQGSGKGTQAKRISAEYGVPHVSTGEIFRAAIADGSELGRRVEPILAAGALVPDELTVGLIRERLAAPDARDGFVLDGFPRTIAQADALDQTLAETGQASTRCSSSTSTTTSPPSGCAAAPSTKAGTTTRPR